MDGGGRLLQSVKALAAPAWPRVAPLLAGHGGLEPPLRARPQPRRRKRRRSLLRRLNDFLIGRWFNFLIVVALTGAVAGYAFVEGGHYDAFVAQNGAAADVAARALGFGIGEVTITGQAELGEGEILDIAGVTSKSSLLFLDAARARERLRHVALIADASIRKLYPNRLLIELTEREPFALWQKQGAVSIISADGTSIDAMRDQRFIDLPFVVGEGANARIGEFRALTGLLGELGGEVRAGILVAGRRWTLKLKSGLEVMLPERDAPRAVETLVRLQKEARVLDKDLISIDLRIPGRMTARLSPEAAAARDDAQAKRPHGKGGPA